MSASVKNSLIIIKVLTVFGQYQNLKNNENIRNVLLSKTELEYLSGKYIPSVGHRRVLNYRIRNKIKEYYSLELPIIQNVTEFSNTITEFSNTSSNNSNKIESLERGTNPRPNAYEAFALPG